MPIQAWVNGESLVRKKVNEQTIFELPLNSGDNELIIKADMCKKSLSMEAQICDSVNVAKIYVERQSGNIIYPLVSRHSKRITLTENHGSILDTTIYISFCDVNGKMICKKELQKDSLRYVIDELEPNKSYLCELHIGDFNTRQPVCCSNADDSYERLSNQLIEIENDETRINAEQLLFRFKFLLNHSSRNDGDWWWQFKIGQLCYEIEHLYAHHGDKKGGMETEQNIQFLTYRSELDGGTQRYILARPNDVNPDKTLPLVVVIRPDIEKHRHIFSSPQIARQWALNHLQALSDEYGYMVIIPEMRTYTDEELTPMAETELLLAIKDVKERYNIDERKVYLHANCSGSYRGLTFAERHPELFAAIALYAPLYEKKDMRSLENAPSTHIDNLRGIPLMIHYDPLDGHSPTGTLKKLIADCKKEDIPLTISVKRNSGELYNVLLVGEEAFNFFKDLSKIDTNKKALNTHNKIKEHNIADLYSKPFLYVFNSSDKSKKYMSFVDSIKSEYENFFFSSLPLAADTAVREQDIKTKNLFLVGDSFTNNNINDLLYNIQQESAGDEIDNSSASMTLYPNPNVNEMYVILYKTNDSENMNHAIKAPWTIFFKFAKASSANLQSKVIKSVK